MTDEGRTHSPLSLWLRTEGRKSDGHRLVNNTAQMNALAFSTQCSVGSKQLHVDHQVLFAVYISTTLANLRITGVLQYSEYEASLTML